MMVRDLVAVPPCDTPAYPAAAAKPLPSTLKPCLKAPAACWSRVLAPASFPPEPDPGWHTSFLCLLAVPGTGPLLGEDLQFSTQRSYSPQSEARSCSRAVPTGSRREGLLTIPLYSQHEIESDSQYFYHDLYNGEMFRCHFK